MYNSQIFHGNTLHLNGPFTAAVNNSSTVPSATLHGLRRPAPKRRRPDTEEIDDADEDEEDQESENVEQVSLPRPVLSEAAHGSSLILPSGKTLRQLWEPHSDGDPLFQVGMFNLDQTWIRGDRSATLDLEHISSRFPAIPEVSNYFKQAIEICRPFSEDFMNCSKYPVPPPYTTKHEIQTWAYVWSATLRYTLFFDELKARAPTHGEVWTDANVWSPLLDQPYLGSKVLTLNRKEISPASKSLNCKHDGIIRSLVDSDWDLGFVEVKPIRLYAGDSGTTIDRTKVLTSILAALRKYNIPGVIIAGILCDGFNVTIIRATLIDDVCFVKSYKQSLCPEKMFHLIGACWKLFVTLEQSHKKLMDTLGDELL